MLISLVAMHVLLALQPISTDDLYSHRLLQGDDGRPRVAVGLVKGRDQVVLRSGQAWEIAAVDAVGASSAAATLEAPAGVIRIQRLAGRPAQMRYAVAVRVLEGAQRDQKHALVKEWRDRGERAFTRDLGLVFGLGGVVVDNRASFVMLRASSSRSRTQRAAAELHDARGVRTEVIALLKTLPVVEVELRYAGQRHRLRTPVVMRARDSGAVVVEQITEGERRKAGPRRYRGDVIVAADASGHLAVVNLVDVDELLKGVVPSEMFASAPIEALKAQAVTARGAVFAKLGRRHFDDPYTLCNNEHCQVYTGLSKSHRAADAAVVETRGELMFLAGHLVDSVYSSTCGGHTENAEVAWDMEAKAALRGRRDDEGAADQLARRVIPFGHGGLGDPARDRAATELSTEVRLRTFLDEPARSWCARSSYARADKLRWTRRFASAEMDRLMFKYGVGHVLGFEVLGRGVSGRVRGLKILGDQNQVVIQREWPVRKALAKLNSGAFVIDEEKDARGKIRAFVFKGMGWGHGVGMCQVGAIGMAEAGRDYRQILGHYYNGAQVERVY